MNRISIVITARNDDYGGNLINRIHTMLHVLRYLTQKYDAKWELILVEYNPPADNLKLSKVIDLTSSKNLIIRTITVKKSFHSKISNNSKIPLFEYIAKNIGIRRAKNTFILSTNQDIIFSEDLFNFLLKSKLSKNVFYRVNRSDILSSQFSTSIEPEVLLRLVSRLSYRVLIKNGCLILHKWSIFHLQYLIGTVLKDSLDKLYLKTKYDHFFMQTEDYKDINSELVTLHEHAAGDFLLMHAESWNKISGYDETPLSDYIDGLALYSAYCHSIIEETIPYNLYHINHNVGKSGRPSVGSERYLKNKYSMIKSGKDYRKKNINWGYPESKFNEERF